ncbi:hypothetical protein HG530_007193 [Fusarium avenaceum]|nr:hypothetical protein HG530_007193 [Fusarium avenaceum]
MSIITNLRIKQFSITPGPSLRDFCALLKLANTEVLGVSLDDAEGVGVTHSALPALDNDDGVAGGQDVELKSVVDSPLDSSIDILLPVDLSEVGLGLREQEGVDATVQMGESRCCGASGHHEDGAHGTVLGKHAGRLSRGGQDDDTTGTKIKGGTDGGHGTRLDSADGALDESAHLLEMGDVGDGVLSLEASLVHLLDSLGGVATLGGLTGKHDTVGTISDGVSDIADLGTGRAGVLDHGLEHLSSADNGLASKVAHGNELLLGSKHLSSRNLNTKITTGNHDTVCSLEDLSEVVETLSVLNLGDDLNVLALLTEDLTDVGDILGAADERGENHVNIVLDTKSKIGLVLLGESGQIDIGVGQVDTLLGADGTVVAGSDLDSLLVGDLKDVESEDTVVDVDDTARLDDVGNVLVVDVPEEVSKRQDMESISLTCSCRHKK